MYATPRSIYYYLTMNPRMQEFAARAVEKVCYTVYAESNPFMKELIDDGEPPKVYLVVYVRDAEYEHTPLCVAPVPVAEFASSNIGEMIANPRFQMRTLIVSSLGYPNMKIMDIQGLGVLDDRGTEPLDAILAGITKKMWCDVEEQKKKTRPGGFRSSLSAMDVQGVILYCNPHDSHTKNWISYIKQAMIDVMWSAQCEQSE